MRIGVMNNEKEEKCSGASNERSDLLHGGAFCLRRKERSLRSGQFPARRDGGKSLSDRERGGDFEYFCAARELKSPLRKHGNVQDPFRTD